MKVCFIAWEKFGVGGVSRALTQTANALTNRHEVSIYCLRKAPIIDAYGLNRSKIRMFHHEMNLYEKIRRSIVDVLTRRTPVFASRIGAYLYGFLRYTRSYKRKLINNLNAEKYDAVIFGSGFEDSLLLAIIKPQIPSTTRIISWSHASYDDYFSAKGKYFSKYFSYAVANYYHRFDDIVVLSDYDCRKFLENHSLRTKRIYNASSIYFAKYSTLQNKSFVYVGSLSKQKGVDLVIDAFAKFCKKKADWHLHVYGEGVLSSYITEQAVRNGIEHLVTLHGNVEDMSNEYIKHSILLFPSRCEGFGMVQVEAMSGGLPIIASDIPVCKELMQSSNAGKLFSSGSSDSLCSAMFALSQTDLNSLALNAIDFSKQFTVSNIMEDWESMLQELIK